MVSHKRLEFGDNGYCLPASARARRSARKKRFFEKKLGDDGMWAFDLLATVAGKLLGDECVDDVQNISVSNEEKPVCEDNLCKGSSSPYDDILCEPASVMPHPRDALMNEEVKNDTKGSEHAGGDGDGDGLGHKRGSSSSNSRAGLPACRKDVPCGPRSDVNVVSRDDDDEKLSGYSNPCRSKTLSRHRTVTCIKDRRIRKILASRCWKGGLKKADGKAKRNYVLHHQRHFPIKKRHYFDYVSQFNSGSRTIPSIKRQNRSRDSHVRLRIKSFRVPELFIEIPETATVGSLKRMVMEAVSNVLGGGLRVGLMLQGKKVGDESQTLLQTGLSQDTPPFDSLGFCLEPICSAADMSTVIESDHAGPLRDPCHSQGRRDDGGALVPIGSSRCNHKRHEQQHQGGHRRIRRPFSVAEVESLVHAVEKLGSGRWRDVKMCAFEKEEHRTYVDLKDKWKTLVHTARIAPEQRRGEALPQELLDRVLKAHSYWTQQLQQKQVKADDTTLCSTLPLLPPAPSSCTSLY